MATFKKSLSAKTDQNGKSQILLFVFVNKENRFRIKTPFYISRNCFNESAGEISTTNCKRHESSEAAQTKIELDLFICNLASKISEQANSGNPISKEWIEEAMHIKNKQRTMTEAVSRQQLALTDPDAKKASSKIATLMGKDGLSVNDAIDLYIATHTLSIGRKRHYNVTKRIGERFAMFKRETDDRDFQFLVDNTTPAIILELREFMLKEAALKEEHPKIFERIEKKLPIASNLKKPRKTNDRGNNYVINIMKRYKAVFNWLYKTDQTQNQPFKNIPFGAEVYGTPIYITREERDKIADFDLSGHSENLQIQRDIFVFQCLVGCRVSDLEILTHSNITNGVLEYVPIKTKDHIEQVKPIVPLTQRALTLINKYKGIDNNGRLFPFFSHQKYNDSIKEIFSICGITRNVIVRNSVTGKNESIPINEVASSHMARRTFIGICYKNVKDPNLIGTMSGHVSGSKAFNRYRAIDIDDLKEVISAIE